jgi:hypothetical protein
MTAVAGKRDSLPLGPSAGPTIDSFLSTWLVLAASPAKVVALAALPVAAAIWALLSAPVVLSQEMTWDLLFNLAGAWHLHVGHVAHVDFHEPVGELNFLLTDAGFGLVGVGPRAFLVGAVVVAVALFAAAASTAWRRLPPLPAAIFVMFVCLLALMPANVGDKPNEYTFAMSYNRYGWSCISVLFLILFQPPRPQRWGNAVDIAVAAALLAAMFYLKMTYFLVGMVALPVAAAVCVHVRGALRGWCALGVAACALAVAPLNRPYWADLFAAADAGQLRDDLADHFANFLKHGAEYAPYIAAIAVAFWLWRRNDAPLRLPVATGFILAAGAALLSQNAQTHGLPAAIIIAFLFYAVLRKRHVQHLHRGSLGLLLALLVFPLLAVGTSTASLAGYYLKAVRQTLQTVDGTNLRGLAVPPGRPGLLAAFAGPQPDYHLLNRARAVSPRYELSPSEYVGTLLDAVALLGEAPGRHGRIVVLDQVNPFPFMLGLVPPRGGNLWSGPDEPKQAPQKLFADADCVLIPKFSTYGSWTQQAVAVYGPYLDHQFPLRAESESWILRSRRPARPATSDWPVPIPDLISIGNSIANTSSRRP